MDSEKSHHLQESPLTMTLPLIFLGIFALIGGWIGIPEVLHGKDHFFQWLAPLFPYGGFYHQLELEGHGVELLLTIVTLVWVFHIGLFTVILYVQKPQVMERARQSLIGVHRLLENKFYVDEIFHFMFVRPIEWFSRVICWRFGDEKVVDGLLVGGSAQSVSLIGRTLNLLQSGLVQSYVLFFVIGAIGIIAYFVL